MEFGLYFSVDHGNHGGFDLHAGGHANVEQLMVEARVDDGLDEEQTCVQVAFPDFRVVILGERYQRSAHNSEAASSTLSTLITLSSFHSVQNTRQNIFHTVFPTQLSGISENVVADIGHCFCLFRDLEAFGLMSR